MSVTLRIDVVTDAIFDRGQVRVDGDPQLQAWFESMSLGDAWRSTPTGMPYGADPDDDSSFASWASGYLGGEVIVHPRHQIDRHVRGRVY